jgi:pilus assembly protein CpaE
MEQAATERIVLLCSLDETVVGSADALAAVGYTPVRCGTLKEVQRELGESVVAVVLDAELPKNETFAIYRFLRKESKVPFLVLLPRPTGGESGWSMEADHGEHEDFARKPISTAELVLRLNALLIHSGAFAPTDTGIVGVSQSSTQIAGAMAGFGKVICVFGAKGGIGKTMFAVSIAVGLARFVEARVVLVDGDLWMGDSLVTLNITATRSIVDATIGGIPADPEIWLQVLVDHPSGIKVLAPPAHLEDVERVPDGAVAAAALALRRYFDFVVVDLDDNLSESNLNVLELADQVLVIVTPELGTVRNTLRLLTASSDIGLKDRIRIVLNRSDSGLEAKQVQSIIPRPIIAMVPSDGRLMVAAANLGQTIFDVDSSGRTAARRALEALVRDVADYGRPKTSRPKTGMLSGLLGKGSKSR